MAITLRYLAVVANILISERCGVFGHKLSIQLLNFLYNYRIRSATIICPGSVHDSLAYACSTLAFVIHEGNLPQGLFLNGDNEYACDKQMVTPYPGRGINVENGLFNFYLSRVRINIECEFGMLHARWGIL